MIQLIILQFGEEHGDQEDTDRRDEPTKRTKKSSRATTICGCKKLSKRRSYRDIHGFSKGRNGRQSWTTEWRDRNGIPEEGPRQ